MKVARGIFRAGLTRLAALLAAGAAAGCAAPETLLPVLPDAPAVLQRAEARNLVSVPQACPGVKLSLRYATANNFTGRVVYPRNMPCLLHRDTAAKLRRAQIALEQNGLRLVIWDAWRPPEVQRIFWNLVRNPDYVAKPGKNGPWSWHCHGRAVDVTLADAAGNLLPMPTEFDDFSPRAAAAYAGGDPAVARRLRLLQTEMVRAGFRLLDSEWWHFSDPTDPRPDRPVFGADLGLTAAP